MFYFNIVNNVNDEYSGYENKLLYYGEIIGGLISRRKKLTIISEGGAD